jgi:hypothetical protein
MPIYFYAQKMEINHLILLSPNHLVGKKRYINTKNLKIYFHKLFDTRTWLKIIKFNINLKTIISHIFRFSTPKSNSDQVISKLNHELSNSNQINILCVFGEKDKQLSNYLNFWRNRLSKNKFVQYTEEIIKNADHSYFGWQYKLDVQKCIKDWFYKI